MHVTISDGTHTFECETNTLSPDAKALCDELIEGTIELLNAVFEKDKKPLINTFEKVE